MRRPGDLAKELPDRRAQPDQVIPSIVRRSENQVVFVEGPQRS
jgi:hypothetical protein